MDREDGEDFDLTSQTTQPHNIVGSQMPTTEIKDVRYTDDPSMYWNDEVNEGKLAFGEPEEETQHQDRREETQHQDRRTLRRSLEHWKQWYVHCASFVSVPRLIRSCAHPPVGITLSTNGEPRTILVL